MKKHINSLLTTLLVVAIAGGISYFLGQGKDFLTVVISSLSDNAWAVIGSVFLASAMFAGLYALVHKVIHHDFGTESAS